MNTQNASELLKASCRPCEDGVTPFSAEEADAQVKQLNGWYVVDGNRIRKEWAVKDFMAGVDFVKHIAEIAESENHHPDIHIERYRRVAIELMTHAISGLSINDFILAAKIDQIPVQLKT